MVVFAIMLFHAPGCADDAPSADANSSGALTGRLTLTGSSTIAPLAGEIAKRFESLHPGVRVDVQTGGSSQGIADARRGTADIGMSSRALNEAERAAVSSHLLARDGIAILVHADNPLTNLTDDQVRDIYTGRITRWNELGNSGDQSDRPITVINRADGRSEIELISAYLDIAPRNFRADLVSGENQHGIRTVAGDRNAIIYMSVGASEFAIKRGDPLKLVQWNGIDATAQTVATGEFPVTRPLILITSHEPTALTRAFLDFALHPQHDDLIQGFFYVPPRR